MRSESAAELADRLQAQEWKRRQTEALEQIAAALSQILEALVQIAGRR